MVILKHRVTIFFIIYIILWPVLSFIGIFNKNKEERVSQKIVQAMFKYILLCAGTKVTVIGEENVPKDEPVLYIGNHKSNFDTIITYARCPNLTGYVAKNNLEKIPFLRTWMKRLHCLFLNREDIREGLKVILTAIDYVKEGYSICIFPEGGRNKTENPTIPFHEGSFKVATKTGCKIIPMAIANSEHIMETQTPFLKATHVVLQYGKPIDPAKLEGDDKKFIGAYTRRIIEEMLEDNKKYLLKT